METLEHALHTELRFPLIRTKSEAQLPFLLLVNEVVWLRHFKQRFFGSALWEAMIVVDTDWDL
jgi:hypothetical protein